MFKGISVGAGAIPLLTSHLCFYVSRSCVYRFGRPSLGLRAARGGFTRGTGAMGASQGQGGQPGPGGPAGARWGQPSQSRVSCRWNIEHKAYKCVLLLL